MVTDRQTDGRTNQVLLVGMLNIVGEREDPTWDFLAMFVQQNVPSVHSFPFVKQDLPVAVTCVLYISRTVSR